MPKYTKEYETRSLSAEYMLEELGSSELVAWCIACDMHHTKAKLEKFQQELEEAEDASDRLRQIVQVQKELGSYNEHTNRNLPRLVMGTTSWRMAMAEAGNTQLVEEWDKQNGR